MKVAHCGWTIVLAASCGIALGVTAPRAVASARTQDSTARSGNNQGDALAAAARRAQEKQKNQANPPKVWDNDNIPTSNHVNVIGSSGSAGANNAAQAQAAPAEQKKQTGKADLEAQLKSAKDDLKNLQTQLDFARRKLALDQQDFYQNPDYSSDAAGAQALKNEQSQIDATKQQVDAAQKKVDDLAAKVQAAGDNGSDNDQNSNGGAGSSNSSSGNSNGGAGDSSGGASQ